MWRGRKLEETHGTSGRDDGKFKLPSGYLT
jgi:hypothetical protein